MSAQNLLEAIPLPPGVEEIKIGFKIAGQWHWNTVSSPSSVGAPAKPLHSARPTLPAPRAANRQPAPVVTPARREAPAMTMGRDPAKFLFTFGKFKGQYMEDVDADAAGRDELYGWWESLKDEKEPSPQLEVALEMVFAYLSDREYQPKPKYTTPRRVK